MYFIKYLFVIYFHNSDSSTSACGIDLVFVTIYADTTEGEGLIPLRDGLMPCLDLDKSCPVYAHMLASRSS